MGYSQSFVLARNILLLTTGREFTKLNACLKVKEAGRSS